MYYFAVPPSLFHFPTASLDVEVVADPFANLAAMT
jgi:hypothetical protein